MAEPKNYITPEGLRALKDEVEELLHKERPKVVETVAWAASNGDRSENADYIYGKRRLREIDRRIRFLGKRIDAAQIIDPSQLDSDKVVFGATVVIEGEDEEQRTFQIVGQDEIDVKHNKISWQSPLAAALLGKKVGDEVLVKKPKSEEWVVIVKIKFD